MQDQFIEVQVHLDYNAAAAATVDTRYTGIAAAGEWQLKKAYFLPNDTTAANATDYVTVNLLQGATTLGSLATSSTAFTAGTVREFTLSGAASLEFGGACADPLKITVVTTGTAGAAVDGVVVARYQKILS